MSCLKVFLLICILLVYAKVPKYQHGTNWRIMNGQIADWKEYRFMAFLSGKRSMKVKGKVTLVPYKCSGTLISPRWVLTAGHCIPESSGRIMKIVLGHSSHVDQIIDENLAPYYISNFQVVHGQYTHSGIVFNDIGLVKITGEVQNPKNNSASYKVAMTKNITTVKLSKKHVKKGTQCKVAGWGYVNATMNDTQITGNSSLQWSYEVGDLEDRLYDVGTEVSNFRRCSRIDRIYWMTHPDKTKQFIWAKSFKNHIFVGPMHGDSGGPLMCNGEQAGLVSGGRMYADFACDKYVRIEMYLPWINRVINKFDNSSGKGNGTVLKFHFVRAASTMPCFNFIINIIVIIVLCT